MVDPKVEEVYILVIREAASQESVPQICGSWNEGDRMQLPSN